jgi:D-alanyl-D-alanine carboxypeptidase/D-alanyl-D-alanine-endopeptidase (penicillin-binding protein 4)
MTHNDLPLRVMARRAAAVLLVALFLTPGVPPSTEGRPGVPGEASAQSGSQRRAPTRSRSARRALSTAPATSDWTVPTGAGALFTDLHAILGGGVRSGQWGVLVVSLTRGDTLYSVNPDGMLQPASNMKLFTTALALDQFPPSHQFSTDVLYTGTLSADGSIDGDLILRGGGDPGLSSRFVEGGPSAPMDSLASRIANAGITRIRGRLIADATAYDAQRIPDGWQSRYLHASYAARVSALSLNENLAVIAVSPTSSGKAPAVSVEPASPLPVFNKARTVAGRRSRIVVIPRAEGGVELRGWIGSRAGTQRYQVVVEEPVEFTAGAFRRALANRGITIEGETVQSATPESAVRIAALPSPPLRDLLAVMNRESINHYAELLFRNAGRAGSDRHVGTVETANELLQQFMVQKVGATPGSVYAADGSGLSVLDQTTPRALVQLLDYAHRAPWGETFHASLPVAGESELLRNRMRRTPAQGNLHAKTGTTNSVISLAGYVTAESGELLAFAFIYNGTDRWRARTTIDAMGPTLASFVRR